MTPEETRLLNTFLKWMMEKVLWHFIFFYSVLGDFSRKSFPLFTRLITDIWILKIIMTYVMLSFVLNFWYWLFDHYYYYQGGDYKPVHKGTEKEFTAMNLNPGSTYKLRVVSESKAGKGTWSSALLATTLPVCPRNCQPPTCTKAEPTSLYLEWGNSLMLCIILIFLKIS